MDHLQKKAFEGTIDEAFNNLRNTTQPRKHDDIYYYGVGIGMFIGVCLSVGLALFIYVLTLIF